MGSKSTPEVPWHSEDLVLLRLNYEYLLSSCSENQRTAELKARMDEIESQVIALFWRLKGHTRRDLAGQFRAFIQMGKSFLVTLS